MIPEKFLQKNYLRNFLLLLIVIFLASSCISVLTLYFDIYRPLDTNYNKILSVIAEIMDTLIIRTAKIYVLFYVFITVGIVYLAILYTHRIVGPLQRIKSEAKSIGKGNLNTEIRLRRKDAISAFAETINEMTESLHEKVDYLVSESQELRNAVQELKSLAGENQDTQSAFKKVNDHNNNICKLLKSLKL